MGAVRVGIFLAAVLSSVVGCGRTVSTGQTALPAPTPRAESVSVSTLTGVAFGTALARASADGALSTDDKASGADQPITTVATQEGNERRRSCGSATPSQARATATFTPLPADGARQFGFALSTTASARGGSWRERLVLCRTTRKTIAFSDARASGRVDLTFTGSASDQLIIRVSGATPREAQLEVRDERDQLLPLSPVPGEPWVAATLSTPGSYSVRASIASRAENRGGGTANGGTAHGGTTISVSVHSIRSSLASADRRERPTTRMFPLPLFIGTDVLNAAVEGALFGEHHRLYPCAKVDCETDRLRDVYLERPRVSTENASVVLEMRLSGSYQIARVFGGGVSGTIRVTATPVVEHDTLRFGAPSVDVASRNTIVKWRSAAFERKLLDHIETVRIDLTPQLQAAVARAQEHLSEPLGGACLLLAPKEAHVRSVQVVTTAPQGIVANFDITLSEASETACQKRNAGR